MRYKDRKYTCLKVYEKTKVGNNSRKIFKSIYLLIMGVRKVGGSKEKKKEEIREKKAEYQKEIVKERRFLKCPNTQ